MQGIDHKMLANYLLEMTDSVKLHKHKKAFRFGCIEPDWNPFTYMRGFFRTKAFIGHNTKISQTYIKRSIARLQKRGLHSRLDFFTLGTLIHYISDSFTYPHNEKFRGNAKHHAAYESTLHDHFSQILEDPESEDYSIMGSGIIDYIKMQRWDYDTAEQSFMNDCNHILKVCQVVFYALLEEKELNYKRILL